MYNESDYQWPIWIGAGSLDRQGLKVRLTYPDYPVHIQTLTLKRLYKLVASANKGKI